jgi:hypothetical protein
MRCRDQGDRIQRRLLAVFQGYRTEWSRASGTLGRPSVHVQECHDERVPEFLPRGSNKKLARLYFRQIYPFALQVMGPNAPVAAQSIHMLEE